MDLIRSDLTILISSHILSTIICLGYVLMSEMFVSVLKNIAGFSDMAAGVIGWCIRHSIYGMSSLVIETSGSTDFMVHILINAFGIISLSTMIGLFIFNKIEF